MTAALPYQDDVVESVSIAQLTNRMECMSGMLSVLFITRSISDQLLSERIGDLPERAFQRER